MSVETKYTKPLKDLLWKFGVWDDLTHEQIAELEDFIEASNRDAQIELLEEVLKLPDTNGGCTESHVAAKFTSWFEDRLAELKEQE